MEWMGAPKSRKTSYEIRRSHYGNKNPVRHNTVKPPTYIITKIPKSVRPPTKSVRSLTEIPRSHYSKKNTVISATVLRVVPLSNNCLPVGASAFVEKKTFSCRCFPFFCVRRYEVLKCELV